MNTNKLIQRFLTTLSLTVAIGLPASLAGALEDTVITPILASILYVDHEHREILVMEHEGVFGDEPVETTTWFHRTFSVSKDVAAFDYVRAGDKVTLKVKASLALDVRKPTDEELADPFSTATRTTKKGSIEHVITGVCKIVATDKKNNTVTFQGPKGQKVKVRVARDQMLSEKKVGDSVVVTYTQSEVVGLKRAD